MHRPDESSKRQCKQDNGEAAALHAGERKAITDRHREIVDSTTVHDKLGRHLNVPITHAGETLDRWHSTSR